MLENNFLLQRVYTNRNITVGHAISSDIRVMISPELLL